MVEWHNYGDVNFMKYGGCLIKEDDHQNCFHVLSLTTEIHNCTCYKGNTTPVIVAKCYVDLDSWMKDDEIKEFNECYGYEKHYKPSTLEEKMSYCIDLINWFGIQEFDPDFPEETGCGCYAIGTIDKWIVNKTVARKFMKECGVHYKFRK